ncbi:MAG: aroma-sacti cluster domain-containing protein [Jatrophihabitantaceae bacterium]
MTTYSDPSLAALDAAGFPLEAISDEQREVFRTLSDDEVTLLIDIRSRLDEVAPEVQAHVDIAGAGLF